MTKATRHRAQVRASDVQLATQLRARSVRVLLTVVTGFLVAIGLWAAAVRNRSHGDLPPLPDLSSADPEVRAFIQQSSDNAAADPNDPSRWATLGMAFEAN